MVMNLDFAETFLDIAGVQIPADMQGKSIKPILEGQDPADWRKSVYYHYYEFPQPHHVHPHYGVRTDRYKLIHFYTIDAWELFDLEKDPHELKSVYNDPAYASVVDEMKKELKRLMEQYKDDGTTVVKYENPNPPMPKGKAKAKAKSNSLGVKGLNFLRTCALVPRSERECQVLLHLNMRKTSRELVAAVNVYPFVTKPSTRQRNSWLTSIGQTC